MIVRIFYACIIVLAGFFGGIIGSLVMQMYPVMQEKTKAVIGQSMQNLIKEQKPEDALSRTSQSVVRIVNTGGVPMRHISFGVFVSSDGWLIAPGQFSLKNISVIDGENRAYSVKKILYQSDLDVSIMQSNAVHTKPVELLDRSMLTDTFHGFILKGFSSIEPLVITSVGYPFSRILSGPFKPHELAKRFNYDQKFETEQYSVFTSDGVLVGFTSEYGIIPISSFKEHLPRIFKMKKFVFPTVKVLYYDLAWQVKQNVKKRERTFEQGAMLYGDPRTAYRLKSEKDKSVILYGGDVINAVNDERIDRNRGLADIVQQYKPGDSITLYITRGKNKKESQVKIMLDTLY